MIFVFYTATVPAKKCAKGVSSLSDVTNEAADGVAGVAVDGTLFVFPNINFTCETKVLKWTFAAQIPDGVILSSRAPPLMQVWRETTNVYTRVFSFGDGNVLGITTEQATGDDHRMLIHYTLNEEATVQAGDVFGLFVPGGGYTPRFCPLFLDLGAGNASSYFYTLGAQSTTQNLIISALTLGEQYVPLVALIYG